MPLYYIIKKVCNHWKTLDNIYESEKDAICYMKKYHKNSEYMLINIGFCQLSKATKDGVKKTNILRISY